MDREEGMRVLTQRGWLSGTPVEFQRAMLSDFNWCRLDAGAPIQIGGEEFGELIGLARGVIELTTIFGPADTPVMHLEYPAFWLGFRPIFSPQPRRLAVTTRTPVWLAKVPQARVRQKLAERPEWWQHFLPLALAYGNAVVSVAADLLIRDAERRCAAVLLRMSGRRFAGPEDAVPAEALLNQNELAAASNLSRSTAGAVLRKLAARGLIELGYRGITVCAPAALRAFVDAT